MYRRKNKTYIVYIVLLLSFISIGYAILSQRLNINGTTQISKVTWDIYFDNIEEIEGSVEASTKAAITNKNTVDFSVLLDKPGDFYAFNVNIVNNGSIDAMIDSIHKTPELTEAQKKYLNYTITYENGVPISTKQLVEKDSFVRLLVKIEFKSDIDASDLLQNNEELDLSFTLNYIQSDENNNIVLNKGMANENVKITGIGTNIGDKICIKDECFMVMFSDEETVTMISEYNLQVGYYENAEGELVPFENPTGLQDPLTLYNHEEEEPKKYAVTAFSETNYWWDTENNTLKPGYPFDFQIEIDDIAMQIAYIYSSDSLIYPYIENYKNYLIEQGLNVQKSNLLSMTDVYKFIFIAEDLHEKNEIDKYNEITDWMNKTEFWAGSTFDNSQLSQAVLVNQYRNAGQSVHSYNTVAVGVRPVIVISKDELY